MKKILTIIGVLSTVWMAQAQDSTSVQLDETVISVQRTAQSKKAVAQTVHVINRSFMERANAPTTADLLQQTGQVFVQRSQQGGGSPVLRGFEASRVLLVVDGVRMNNAIFRTGHLQNVITMDNNALERAEVLFGPASTLYGSDALGGAVCFYTKRPQFSTSKNSVNIDLNGMLRYATVNQEKTAHLDFGVGGYRWASFTSFTRSDFGDLRMGKNPVGKEAFGLRNYYVDRINGRDSLIKNDDPYVQRYSGYTQYDLLEKVAFRQNSRVMHTLNIQYSNSSNIPRYDRLTDPDGAGLRSAEWYYGPQKRLMGAYHLDMSDLGWFNRGMRTIISVQDIEESRQNRRFGRTTLRSQVEQVKVFGFTSFVERATARGSLRTGVDAQYNDVTSTATETNIETNAETPYSTRYPDGGSTMSDVAAFVSLSQQHGKWIFNEGVRGGFSSMKGAFINKDFFPFPFSEVEQQTPTAAANLGAVWLPRTAWRIGVNFSSGFRMPNVDDTGKVFDSQPGSLIVPNPDIKPEQSYNSELNWRRQADRRIVWEGAVWHTALRNAIVTAPFQLNGRDSVLYDGIMSRVLANQNQRKANIYGVSTGLNGMITSYLDAQASITYTRGRIVQDNGDKTPLDHIPPVFGRVGLRAHHKRMDAEVFCIFNGAKPLSEYYLNGEDNEQYAPADGMPAWQTYNVRISWKVLKVLRIQAGIDNLFDAQYRNFASGINAPGRSFFIALRV